MAITIQITPDDLLKTRFAYSPLVELTISYYMLVHSQAHGPYQHWIDETQRSLHGIEFPFLTDLIAAKSDCHYMPDFLTPTPQIVQLDIEDDIQHLLDLPAEVIRASIHRLIEKAGETDIRLFFLAHPHEALFCLVEELRLYWKRALEPHWSRFTAILEGDVLYHARRQALDGTARMLNEVHPWLTYQDHIIQIDKPRLEQLELHGEGLQLVPSIFAGQGIHWQVVPEWHPMLIYAARGVGLWRQELSERNPSLELALGEGRARVLQILAIPSNTGEIARRLDITAGAVSQHLNRLNQAGLAEPYRNGKRVYYHLTDRGAQLLALFA